MSRTRRLLVLSLTLACLPGTSLAQRRKLNGPLATAYLGDVATFDLAGGRILYKEGATDLLTLPLNGGTAVPVFHRENDGLGFFSELTPDGARVVLRGPLERYRINELFSFPADGSGSLVKLNAPLGENMQVYSYAFSPDGRFAVYAIAEFVSGGGLGGPYSVRTDGSQPAVALNGAFAVQKYEITADSSRVLFTDYQGRLHTVPIAGGTPPVLVQAPPGRFVQEFALAPDASRVVYRTDSEQANVYELFSAPVDASQPPVKLNGPLVAGGDVWRFHISPHSQHVTYVADQEVDGTNALYAVPIGGGATIRFTPGVAGREIVEEHSSPDRSRMLYLANHTDAQSFDLYSVPVDGSQPAVNLSATLPTVAQGFLFDPLSERVVFRTYLASGVYTLYGTALDGSTPPVRLDPPGATEGVRSDFAIAAGSRAVFLTDTVGPHRFELYSAPLDGSAPALRLNPPPVEGGSVYSFVLDAARGRALYRAEQDLDDVVELYLVPVDGSAPPAVKSSIREHLSTVGDVTLQAPTPDGTRALYAANQAAGNGVYAVALTGDPQPVWLGGPAAFALQSTPDSRRVVYATGTALYSAPVDASAPAVALGPSSYTWRIAPDSSRVVQVIRSNVYSELDRLLSTPVAGGATRELNLPRTVSGEVFPPEISPDSSRVVYAGIQQTAGVIELFSVPLAGGTAPVRLNGALVAGGGVSANSFFQGPRVSADSSRVVYRADQDVNDELELYSVPLAGGAAPTELSVLPGPDRDVTSFALSPDSSRVVYVADQDADEVYELYSVPLTGGTPTELSALPDPDRDVDSDPHLSWQGQPNPFLISPDSRWVVYRADQDVNDAFELYCAPLAGGAAPVRLTFDATPAATNWLLALSPDSRTVVYERRTSGRLDLYCVPILGGAAPLRLNGPASVTERFPQPDAAFDAGGRWVLFNAARNLSGAEELFAAPSHGLGSPVAVNARLAVGAPTSVSGTYRPGTSSVLYIAEQDEAGVLELYLDELVTSEPGRHRPR